MKLSRSTTVVIWSNTHDINMTKLTRKRENGTAGVPFISNCPMRKLSQAFPPAKYKLTTHVRKRATEADHHD